MERFTLKIASSTMALPEVLAVISRQSRIGTPLAISVAMVRVNRATAILRNSGPMIGSLQQHSVNSVTPLLSPVVRSEHGQENADANPDENAVAADKLAGPNHNSRRKRQIHVHAFEQDR